MYTVNRRLVNAFDEACAHIYELLCTIYRLSSISRYYACTNAVLYIDKEYMPGAQTPILSRLKELDAYYAQIKKPDVHQAFVTKLLAIALDLPQYASSSVEEPARRGFTFTRQSLEKLLRFGEEVYDTLGHNSVAGCCCFLMTNASCSQHQQITRAHKRKADNCLQQLERFRTTDPDPRVLFIYALLSFSNNLELLPTRPGELQKSCSIAWRLTQESQAMKGVNLYSTTLPSNIDDAHQEELSPEGELGPLSPEEIGHELLLRAKKLSASIADDFLKDYIDYLLLLYFVPPSSNKLLEFNITDYCELAKEFRNQAGMTGIFMLVKEFEIFIEHNKPIEALATYTAAIAIFDSQPCGEGHLYVLRGHIKSLVVTMLKQYDPKQHTLAGCSLDTFSLVVLLQLADLMSIYGFPEDASEIADYVLTAQPENVVAMEIKLSVMQQQLKAMQKPSPENSWAGEACEAYLAADKYAQKILALHPHSRIALRQMCESAVRSQDMSRALVYGYVLLEHYPQANEVLHDIITILVLRGKQQDLPRALKLLERVGDTKRYSFELAENLIRGEEHLNVKPMDAASFCKVISHWLEWLLSMTNGVLKAILVNKLYARIKKMRNIAPDNLELLHLTLDLHFNGLYRIEQTERLDIYREILRLEPDNGEIAGRVLRFMARCQEDERAIIEFYETHASILTGNISIFNIMLDIYANYNNIESIRALKKQYYQQLHPQQKMKLLGILHKLDDEESRSTRAGQLKVLILEAGMRKLDFNMFLSDSVTLIEDLKTELMKYGLGETYPEIQQDAFKLLTEKCTKKAAVMQSSSQFWQWGMRASDDPCQFMQTTQSEQEPEEEEEGEQREHGDCIEMVF